MEQRFSSLVVNDIDPTHAFGIRGSISLFHGLLVFKTQGMIPKTVSIAHCGYVALCNLKESAEAIDRAFIIVTANFHETFLFRREKVVLAICDRKIGTLIRWKRNIRAKTI